MLKLDIRRRLKDFNIDVNFEFSKSVLGLLGASGSGKSMTLKMLSGLVKPDSGYIVLDDTVLFDSDSSIDLKPQMRNIGYLFQDYALFPNMTVEKNILAGVRTGSYKEKIKKVNSVLNDLKIEKLKKCFPNNLSGGEKQRVALGRILVNNPKLILLDEPFSALDEYLKWQIEIEVKQVLEEYNIPSILVSHNKDEVYRMCDEVCVLHCGKSEPIQETKSLFLKPNTLSAAMLSGFKNYSEIKYVEKDRVYAIDWDIYLSVLENNFENKIVGINSSSFKILNANIEREENIFHLNEYKVQVELFSVMIIAKISSFAKPLYIEIENNEWERIKNFEDIFIQIKSDDIIFLR
ncbi:sulfate/molybdate ABC transporter ATP-binding protein [Peptoniphilus sp. oral taxon 386]|uniref:sulfate/molybdate ABC transporter ATP-binding protein n=1 Tax=Peptoniphilus sp. oral taxon 386 TaxID=652713 RepID=UPI0002D78804|nr:ATP-binding cassette domain-containing protein [Peptoniphilus sp. oral taxon 386]